MTARAAPAQEVGWWWKAQQNAAVSLPPPPGVPDGGLNVARDPSGEAAVAALRLEAGDGTVDSLTLTVAAGFETAASLMVVRACAVTGAWSPALAGPWSDRPTWDCARAVAGVVAGNRMTWTLSGDFRRGGDAEVMLVPDPAGPAGQVAFAPAGADAVHITPAAPPVVRSDAVASFLPDLVGQEPVSGPLATGALPAPEETPAAASAVSPFDAGPVRQVAPSTQPERGGRATARLLLASLAGLLWWFTRTELRAQGSGEGPRGLGRFRRDREPSRPGRL
jgi:hypothetical protein